MLRRPPTRTDAERTIRLADGRLMGYGEYGDPEGAPALFFHGTPGSRLLGQEADRTAKAAGIRLVALERPGYGLSDDRRGYRVTDWIDDVAVAANALGITRFAAGGVSGGAAYALACGARLPDRVTAVTLVSPDGPADLLPLAHPWIDRRLTEWSRRGRSRRAVALLEAGAGFLRYAPRLALRSLAQGADGRLLADDAVRKLVLSHLREAFRHGARGASDDYAALAGRWGFELSEVTVPVHLWHGEDDRLVPPAIGRALAELMPGCSTTFVPDAGHLLVFQCMEAILGSIPRG